MKNVSWKLLPVLLLILFSTTVLAQPPKKQSTSVILKTASTLLQAQQFDAAEEYYKKALQNAQLSKSSYQQAQAWEGLANLYGKTKQQALAVEAYQKAIKLYQTLGFKVIAEVLNSQMRSVQGFGDLYAGMEIGARGIKLSVIEVKLVNGEHEYSLKLDTAITTDAAALSYQSEKETQDAITSFYQTIRERFDIPSERIHIVIASGLKQELDKYNKVEYFASVVRPKELDAKIKINYITVDQEAELSFKGIVPQLNRLTANQLDVGSGNTKGGYINSNRSFVPVTFPLGTKSFQRLVESRATGNMDIDEYQKAAEKLIIDSLGRMVIYHFRDKAEFKSRDVVYISGGIVWCIASLMYPELIKQNHVELSREDIAKFRKRVSDDYDYASMVSPDLDGKLSPDDVSASLANIKRVTNTYDRKALLMGAIWLEELITQVNTQSPNKKLIYPRYAYVGWISGYIIDKINKQYSEVAKQ